MSEEEYLTEESYEFEFEDDEGSEPEFNESGSEEQLQNQYYNAKAFKDDDPKEAINKLNDIINSEISEDSIIWVFKSTKQVAKIYFQDHDFNKNLEVLEKLLNLIPKVNDKSYLEESINKMFTNYTNVKDNDFVLKISNLILKMINILPKSNNNDRLWIKVNLNKLSILLLDNDRLMECDEIIKNLNLKLNNVSEITKNAYILEIIASEIELLSLNNNDLNLERLNYLYKKSLTIASPVTHPRIIGIIKECGGKIEFFKKNFELARQNFYESFKQFDESGSSEKNKVFKYLILLSIITENEFNPFESQETQHFTQEFEFKILIELIEIFQDLNLANFKTLHEKVNGKISDDSKDKFYQDVVFKNSLQEIENLIIDKILINLFKAYSIVKFDFIANFLKLTEDELILKVLKLNNLGKLNNVKINFIDKFIESSDNKIYLNHINPKIILNNMKCLDAINFPDSFNQILNSDTTVSQSPRPITNVDPKESDDMNIDSNSEIRNNTSKANDSILNQLLFINVKNPDNKDYVEMIDNWFTSIVNSLPKFKKIELSTKDQIFTEQKIEKINLEDLNNFNNQSNNNIPEIDHIEHSQILKKWCNEILQYNFESV